MTDAELRRRARQRLAGLSTERLKLADDLLAYLEEQEADDATAELLAIPGFVAAFEQARRQVAAGKVTPVDALRRKV